MEEINRIIEEILKGAKNLRKTAEMSPWDFLGKKEDVTVREAMISEMVGLPIRIKK